MDGEDVSQAEFTACLEDLAQVNTVTLTHRPTLAFIDRALAAAPADKVMTILDVGFGAGDMLRAISRLAGKRKRTVRLIGFDINPRSEAVAHKRTPASMNIEFRTGDAFAWPETDPLDIIISSQTTHHMDDAEIVRFLSWMEARASLGWFVNDLHRHWFAYYGFGLLAAVMRWHRFVRHDGPVSVARSFRREDWLALLKSANISDGTRIKWWLPFRYCVERAKW